MDNRECLEQQFAFLEEIDKEKLIGRQNDFADGLKALLDEKIIREEN